MDLVSGALRVGCARGRGCVAGRVGRLAVARHCY